MGLLGRELEERRRNLEAGRGSRMPRSCIRNLEQRFGGSPATRHCNNNPLPPTIRVPTIWLICAHKHTVFTLPIATSWSSQHRKSSKRTLQHERFTNATTVLLLTLALERAKSRFTNKEIDYGSASLTQHTSDRKEKKIGKENDKILSTQFSPPLRHNSEHAT